MQHPTIEIAHKFNQIVSDAINKLEKDSNQEFYGFDTKKLASEIADMHANNEDIKSLAVDFCRMFLKIERSDFRTTDLVSHLNELEELQLISFISICHTYLKNNSSADDILYNFCLLALDLPALSKLNKNNITVWRHTSRFGNFDKRVSLKPHSWVQGFRLHKLDKATLIKKLEKQLQFHNLDHLNVRLHDSGDMDGWKAGYSSEHIRSCMSIYSDYSVGDYETYRCYCTKYYGLEDNGLKLAVLYNDNDEAVARAITFDDKYIKVYGDDRLVDWLENNGYTQADGFKLGTTIVAGEGFDEFDFYTHPYVDGENNFAKLSFVNNNHGYKHLVMTLVNNEGGMNGLDLDVASGCDFMLTDDEKWCHRRDVMETEDGCHYHENDVVETEDGYCYHEDDVMETEDGERYHKNDVVETHDGCFYHKHEVIKTDDGKVHHKNDVVKTENGKWYHEDDVMETEDGERYHKNDVVKTEDGKVYHKNDVMETEDGERYHKNDVMETEDGCHYHENDVADTHEGYRYHKNDVIETEDGKWYHENDVIETDDGKVYHKNDVVETEDGKVYHKDFLQKSA